MFYAHFVLTKKGPLARIWLAAHWDKKLTRAHVFETNIESSVEGILKPKGNMALRTSGHLLLGIVRIYSRKAKYLLADCNEAFIKIKMAFRPGVVDLPEENREAAVSTITLPEVFHDFNDLNDINMDMDATLNQSRAEDITLKEDYGSVSLMPDDSFEDMGFDDPEGVRDSISMEDGFESTSFLLSEGPPKENLGNSSPIASTSTASRALDAPLRDDGFGGTVGEGLLDGETGTLFEPAGLFDDAPLDNVALENNAPQSNIEKGEHQNEKPDKSHNDSEDDIYDMGPGSIGAPSPPSSPNSVSLKDNDLPTSVFDTVPGTSAEDLDFDASQLPSTSRLAKDMSSLPSDIPAPCTSSSDIFDTTLVNTEDPGFPLAHYKKSNSLAGRGKRKRKLIIDEVKNISGEEMKSQLSNTGDIVSSLDLAPPSKRLMLWKEIGGVEKLFALPGNPILSTTLSETYGRHLNSKCVDEVFGFEDMAVNPGTEVQEGRSNKVIAQKRQGMEPMLQHDITNLDSLRLESSRTPFLNDTRPNYISEICQSPFPNDTPRPSFHNETSTPFHSETSRPAFANEAARLQFHNETSRPPFHNETSRSQFHDEISQSQFHNQASRTQIHSETSQSQFRSETPRPQFHSGTPRPQFHSETSRLQFHSETPGPQFHSENSRSTFHNEVPQSLYPVSHIIPHSTLEVSNFMQPQHHLFPSMPTRQIPDQPQQQMISNVISSVMSHPPARIMQQMLQNEVNPLAHLPQMMHQMMDQGPSLQSITPSIRNVSSPAVSEAYNQAVHHSVIQPASQNLFPNSNSLLVNRMQQSSIIKQMTDHPLDSHINQSTLQNPLSQNSMNHMACVENNMHSCSDSQMMQSDIDNQVLEDMVDDELTQPCLDEDFIQSNIDIETNSLSNMAAALSRDDDLNAASFENIDHNALPNTLLRTDNNQQVPELQSEPNLFESLGNREVNPQPDDAGTLQNKNNELHTSDDDDYGAPSSIGPILPEEQMEDETYEQFEERILTKRTVHMLHTISNKLDTTQSVSFGNLVKNQKRKHVAQKFYTFLVLKKQQAVELQQESTFGDLVITKGPKFDAVYNSN